TGAAWISAKGAGLGEAQTMLMSVAMEKNFPPMLMQREGVARGKVTYVESGKPAAGVKVKMGRREGAVVMVPYTATTDADGTFRIDGLPQSVYYIAAGEIGKVCAPRFDLRVGAGETVENIDVSLEVGQLVSGLVIDARTGVGIPKVRLFARSAEDRN